VTSAGLADYLHTRSEMLERAADLFSVLKSGAVRVSINQRYPLADAACAHRDLEARPGGKLDPGAVNPPTS